MGANFRFVFLAVTYFVTALQNQRDHFPNHGPKAEVVAEAPEPEKLSLGVLRMMQVTSFILACMWGSLSVKIELQTPVMPLDPKRGSAADVSPEDVV